MANYYLDNKDILFHMQYMDLARVVGLKEEDFIEKEEFAHAPKDLEDALDSYHRVLDIVGEIAGEYIAPRAREVDRQGASLENGQVYYAPGTRQALDRLAQADLMGFTLPRRFGGLNMPKTVYSIATEVISRADAALMNLFGLQEIADTINKFGSEEQKQKYLPRFAAGQTSGAMALTEPDAGSDLQSIMLRATQGDDGRWYLNGVKRFITNGCADVSLVLARSESGSTGGRGLSLFLYQREGGMKIRRIEDKLGIHGSPTCELQFDNAPAELLGRRKMGLVRYTLSLMNGARLGVAAQALGIAEAAYQEADSYARHRQQFKRPIREFAAVYEMLTMMRVRIEAARSLLYETSRIVDVAEGLEARQENQPEKKGELKEELRRYSKYAGLFTPLVKIYATELANQVCYEALQVHGGPGYTREFNVERFYRDARITNIYEGTTQLQVLAAIGGVITGEVFSWLNDFESEHNLEQAGQELEQARQLRSHLESAVARVKEKKDPAFQEFHAPRLVDMTLDTILGYLLCKDALHSQRKRKVAGIFLSRARARVRESLSYILEEDLQIQEGRHLVLDYAE
ncbi:MAG: acyl-CoA dehydrogenase family protein [Desulfohalobiaceae bacterium]